jgi:hypothetical protein
MNDDRLDRAIRAALEDVVATAPSSGAPPRRLAVPGA